MRKLVWNLGRVSQEGQKAYYAGMEIIDYMVSEICSGDLNRELCKNHFHWYKGKHVSYQWWSRHISNHPRYLLIDWPTEEIIGHQATQSTMSQRTKASSLEKLRRRCLFGLSIISCLLFPPQLIDLFQSHEDLTAISHMRSVGQSSKLPRQAACTIPNKLQYWTTK
jgi:hypothetical protein